MNALDTPTGADRRDTPRPAALGRTPDADRLLARARLLADDLGDALAAADPLAVYAAADRAHRLAEDVAAHATTMRRP